MASIPPLGSKISVITKADIRYDGILFLLDLKECTIGLINVKAYGIENNRDCSPDHVIYDYIQFHGSDIKDIIVEVIENIPAIEFTVADQSDSNSTAGLIEKLLDYDNKNSVPPDNNSEEKHECVATKTAEEFKATKSVRPSANKDLCHTKAPQVDFNFEDATNEFEEIRSMFSKASISRKDYAVIKKCQSCGSSTVETAEEIPKVYYDRSKSFFDSLSYKGYSRVRRNWRSERKLNAETFGLESSSRRGIRGRGSYRRRARNRFRNGVSRGNCHVQELCLKNEKTCGL